MEAAARRCHHAGDGAGEDAGVARGVGRCRGRFAEVPCPKYRARVLMEFAPKYRPKYRARVLMEFPAEPRESSTGGVNPAAKASAAVPGRG
jgi:hypothetical protein